MVVRKGATWRGMRCVLLLAAMGGPCRIKSIKSRLSSLVVTAASRGWNRDERTPAEDALLGSVARSGALVGADPVPLRAGAWRFSDGGPVDLMNSAKSAVDSPSTLASLAWGPPPCLPVLTAMPVGARGTGPDGEGSEDSTIVVLLNPGPRKVDGEPLTVGDLREKLGERASSLLRENLVTTGLSNERFDYEFVSKSTKRIEAKYPHRYHACFRV